MKNRRALNWISGLVSLASITAIFLALYPWPPPFNRKVHVAIGQAMAKAAAELLQGSGQIILVARDTEMFPQPAMNTSMASFKDAVGRRHLPIKSIQLIQVDPLRPAEVPPGDFFELIRKASKGDVIVSFLGPPILSEEQKTQLKEIKPAIVALASGNPSVNLRNLFEQHLLHAAIVDRPAGSAAPKTPAFDDLYLEINAATAGRALPEEAAKPL